VTQDIKCDFRSIASERLLKRDSLGSVAVRAGAGAPVVVRDWAPAHPGIRWLARLLCRREAAALARLAGVDGIPRLIRVDAGRVLRTWLDGEPLHRAPPPDRRYFREARRLLHRVHRARVTHNDLAKEANWLSLAGGGAAIVDFQLAIAFRRRSRWFRLLAREDLRHLLKHKRQYLPDTLTQRERALLAQPAWTATLWRLGGKPVYRLVTRGLLGWRDRVSAEERGAVIDRS